MKGIRPILFLLATMLLVGLSTSVPSAYATVATTTLDIPGSFASSGDDEVVVEGKDPDDDEGDPDHYGDGNEVIRAGDWGDGRLQSDTIGERLLRLMCQLKLLVL